MKTGNSNNPIRKKPFDKTVFVEYSSAEPGQNLITVMGMADGKRRIIGRIYREYDNENKKAVYTAKDWSGTIIFPDIKDLHTLKRQFIEHSKNLTITIPKNPKEVNDKEITEEMDRGMDLKEIRDQKADKWQEKNI